MNITFTGPKDRNVKRGLTKITFTGPKDCNAKREPNLHPSYQAHKYLDRFAW